MVATFAAVEAALGPLDIVCNNAGINNVRNEGLKNWQGTPAMMGGQAIPYPYVCHQRFCVQNKQWRARTTSPPACG